MIRDEKGSTMAWTTPTLVEICIGLEINGYLPAEFWSAIQSPDRHDARIGYPPRVGVSRVEFIDENGGGPGVRLRKRQQKKGSRRE
jgi:coenzyme PQQ precursor peptide PqqA